MTDDDPYGLATDDEEFGTGPNMVLEGLFLVAVVLISFAIVIAIVAVPVWWWLSS